MKGRAKITKVISSVTAEKINSNKQTTDRCKNKIIKPYLLCFWSESDRNEVIKHQEER